MFNEKKRNLTSTKDATRSFYFTERKPKGIIYQNAQVMHSALSRIRNNHFTNSKQLPSFAYEDLMNKSQLAGFTEHAKAIRLSLKLVLCEPSHRLYDSRKLPGALPQSRHAGWERFERKHETLAGHPDT